MGLEHHKEGFEATTRVTKTGHLHLAPSGGKEGRNTDETCRTGDNIDGIISFRILTVVASKFIMKLFEILFSTSSKYPNEPEQISKFTNEGQ